LPLIAFFATLAILYTLFAIRWLSPADTLSRLAEGASATPADATPHCHYAAAIFFRPPRRHFASCLTASAAAAAPAFRFAAAAMLPFAAAFFQRVHAASSG